MTVSQRYIAKLEALGPGDRGLLRSCADAPLNQDVIGFDLFTALWWALRNETPRVPAREPSWLVAKLFPWNPIIAGRGSVATGLARLAPRRPEDYRRQRARFESLLSATGRSLEPPLREAIRRLHNEGVGIDWVSLLDDLTGWDKPGKWPQRKWAEEWHYAVKGNRHAY